MAHDEELKEARRLLGSAQEVLTIFIAQHDVVCKGDCPYPYDLAKIVRLGIRHYMGKPE